MDEAETLKGLFLQHIRTERRLAAKTVETYDECLKLFIRFIRNADSGAELCDVNTETVRDWMEWLMDQGRSAAYVNKNLAALRTFYKFCYAQGYVKVDPVHTLRGPKKEKRLPTFLKESELERLLDLLGENTDDIKVMRTRTIIYIFYATGLRAAELISLDDDMVNFVTKEIKITGKRDKQRVIPFAHETEDVLRQYITLRDAVIERTDGALFVTDKGQRMNYGQVRKIVRDALSLVTTSGKRSPHVLRHTFATAMLNHDANLEAIKKLLGHQSLDTTEIYTHTTFEKLKEVYNEAHPRA